MPATVNDTLLFTSALWVIFKRLDRATSTEGCLDKMKWTREGTAINDSVSNLPNLQPLFVELDSKPAIGAPKNPQGHATKANLPVMNSYVLRLRLRTELKHGFVRRDPNNVKEHLGHLEWAGLVMDAIETGDDGLADSQLEQTARGPVSFGLRPPEFSSLAIESIIEVIFDGRAHQRIERGYTFPVMSAPPVE